MEDRIHLAVNDGIADVRLARPTKLNALDPAMFEAIAEADARLRQNKSVRAVVLSGEGRGFCAGLDIERMTAIISGEPLLPFADLTKRTALQISSSTSSGNGANCRSGDRSRAWFCLRRWFPACARS